MSALVPADELLEHVPPSGFWVGYLARKEQERVEDRIEDVECEHNGFLRREITLSVKTHAGRLFELRLVDRVDLLRQLLAQALTFSRAALRCNGISQAAATASQRERPAVHVRPARSDPATANQED